MQNTEFNYDLPNIVDILDEKVQISDIFHFGLVQKIFEEFIKRQNAMNQKLNALEIKFDSWSLTHSLGVDTEKSNKADIENEINKEDNNEKKLENELNDNDNIDNGKIDEKLKGLSKKIKKLELINKEMAQRLIVNNNENSEKMTTFVETSEEKIKQIYSSFKNIESNVNQKERVINNQVNKMNQLIKKIELLETTMEENKTVIKNINKDIFNLQRLKMDDLVNEFYKFKNESDKTTKDIKKLIEEKIIEFKNNLLGKKAQKLEDPNSNIDISSSINELQLRDMANELKSYTDKCIQETNKSLKKIIFDLNIQKITQDISIIQKELKEKLSSKNLVELNIKMEDYDNKLIELKSLCAENTHSFEYSKEHISKMDKNIEFLSTQLNRLNVIEQTKEQKNNDLINNEGIKLFVKKESYEEDMTKVLKKMEKIFIFQQEYMTKLGSLEKKLKLFATDKDIKNIEHYTLNMIQEFKINTLKKYLEKKEAFKSLKLLGLQIKNINEYLNLNNNISTDRIIMGNSLNNSFCPNCENKITNQKISKNTSIGYRPNKNMEKNELKNYRMGQGFSHMLQLINSDLMKSAEKINDDITIKVDDNNNNNYILNEKEIHNRSSIENKSLPRLNSQKSFSILNGEAKNNDLDSSNYNISGQFNNENNNRTIRNNSIDKIYNNQSDVKNKMFKKIEKMSPWKNNSNQIVYTKLKKYK